MCFYSDLLITSPPCAGGRGERVLLEEEILDCMEKMRILICNPDLSYCNAKFITEIILCPCLFEKCACLLKQEQA